MRVRRSNLRLAVDRLCRLLDHPISLMSRLGKGSCLCRRRAARCRAARSREGVGPCRYPDQSDRKLVVLIDDDPLVLEGTGGRFPSWGWHVVTAGTDGAALAGLAERDHPPDLIVSGYYLPSGKTGIEAIEGLRKACSVQIPGFIVSGDTSAESLREARANGYYLLHKPVDPIALRATLSQVLRSSVISSLIH
jgi:CheY-like chemotaxis protein